ncbi:hypothetical protein [Allosphingosinicella humi]
MASYRLYFMNPRNGHIERFHEFAVANDTAAIDYTLQQELMIPIELWCRHRKVCRIDPSRSEAVLFPGGMNHG